MPSSSAMNVSLLPLAAGSTKLIMRSKRQSSDSAAVDVPSDEETEPPYNNSNNNTMARIMSEITEEATTKQQNSVASMRIVAGFGLAGGGATLTSADQEAAPFWDSSLFLQGPPQSNQQSLNNFANTATTTTIRQPKTAAEEYFNDVMIDDDESYNDNNYLSALSNSDDEAFCASSALKGQQPSPQQTLSPNQTTSPADSIQEWKGLTTRQGSYRCLLSSSRLSSSSPQDDRSPSLMALRHGEEILAIPEGHKTMTKLKFTASLRSSFPPSDFSTSKGDTDYELPLSRRGTIMTNDNNLSNFNTLSESTDNDGVAHHTSKNVSVRSSSHPPLIMTHKNSDEPSSSAIHNVSSRMTRSSIIRSKYVPSSYHKKKRKKRTTLSKHMAYLPFGAWNTMIPLIACLAAILLSIGCKRSSSFVTLENPMLVGADFARVDEVGLCKVKLCLIGTATLHNDDDDDSNGSDVSTEMSALTTSNSNETTTVDSDPSNDDDDHNSCTLVTLRSDMVAGTMWNISRICVSWTTVIGCFVFLLLSTCIVWKTINFKPIASGVVIAYVSQSMAFFFFDSDLCRTHGCRIGAGARMAIFSSILWFMSGVGLFRLILLQQRLTAREKRSKSKLFMRERKKRRSFPTIALEHDDVASTSLEQENRENSLNGSSSLTAATTTSNPIRRCGTMNPQNDIENSRSESEGQTNVISMTTRGGGDKSKQPPPPLQILPGTLQDVDSYKFSFRSHDGALHFGPPY